MEIRLDDRRGPEIRALLEEHLASMRALSPPESVHALDLERLRAPTIRFFTLWDGDALLGCGAWKRLDGAHAEIKSMRTAEAHRGRGVARRLLEHLIADARAHGIERLSLETGSMAAFAPARQLYARFGFIDCGPFADYVVDPNSHYMTRGL
jgi:putative acetyltransferase